FTTTKMSVKYIIFMSLVVSLIATGSMALDYSSAYRSKYYSQYPSGRQIEGSEPLPTTTPAAPIEKNTSVSQFIFEILGASSGKLRSMALSLVVYLAEYVTKSMFNLGENNILHNEIPQYRSLVKRVRIDWRKSYKKQ
ncbi:Hypothetical protein FKW44_009779, partial [Caligus rogercresseyi]